jgi:hypothetical protein
LSAVHTEKAAPSKISWCSRKRCQLASTNVKKVASYAEITSTKVNHSISKTESHLRLMNVLTTYQEMSYIFICCKM